MTTLSAIILAGMMLASASAWAQSQVVAAVGSMTIYESDVDAQWAKDDPATFNELHERTYVARKQSLDRLISNYLLSAEAAKRGMTVEDLQRDITSRAPTVSEGEMRGAYESYARKPTALPFDAVKAEIGDFLRRQAAARIQTAYVEQLGRSVTIDLAPFRDPVKVDAGDRAVGNSAAAVDFIEFADFECPYCKQVESAIQRLRQKYGERVRFVWKDDPLPMHANAKGAAAAALCADDQGVFWKYHDLLFAHQPSLAAGDLKIYATQLGLDMKSFAECFDGGKYRLQVANAQSAAVAEGVLATPAMFINGRPVIGAVEFEMLDYLISRELEGQKTWRIGP